VFVNVNQADSFPIYLRQTKFKEFVMEKCEYAFLVFTDNQFLFYEANREPRLLFQLKKPSILGISTKPDSDLHQTIIKAINLVAREGWELSLVGYGVLIWYFKRPIGG
jgi:hypothetical protein